MSYWFQIRFHHHLQPQLETHEINLKAIGKPNIEEDIQTQDILA